MGEEFKVPKLVRPIGVKSVEGGLEGGSLCDEVVSNAMVLKFECPEWAGVPVAREGMTSYFLEVVKDGSIVQVINLDRKSFYVFGRAPICDIVLDHESISRQHAVIIFKSDGDAFIYDLGSTHGTFVNRDGVLEPKVFKQLFPGHSIQFGLSTRRYFLNGGVVSPPTVINTEIVKGVVGGVKANCEEDSRGFTATKVLTNRKFRQGGEEYRDESDIEASSSSEIDSSEEEKQRNMTDFMMVKNLLGRELFEDGNEDDEFYDRTKQRPEVLNPPQMGSMETYETSLFKKNALEKFIKLLKDDQEALTRIIDLNNEKNEENSDADPLDTYMDDILCNETELQFMKHKKNLLKKLEMEVAKIDEIIHHLAPKNTIHHFPTLIEKNLHEYFGRYNEFLRREYEKTGLLSQLNREKRQLDAEQPEDNASGAQSSPIKVSKFTCKNQVLAEEPNAIRRSSPSSGLNEVSTYKENGSYAESETITDADGEYEVWSAPEGQIGTGRTELNDKYGY